jgi:hypothetical protein
MPAIKNLLGMPVSVVVLTVLLHILIFDTVKGIIFSIYTHILATVSLISSTFYAVFLQCNY